MLDVAKKAALEAGEIVMRLRGKKTVVRIKEGNLSNVVTKADLLSERRILEIIKEKYPKHNFISEEIGREDNGSEFTWIIDPIDGTGPYSSGLPFFGVSVGLLKNNKLCLGVVNLPAFKSLYWGGKETGGYLNDQKIKVSFKNRLGEVMVGSELGWAGTRKSEIKRFIWPLVDKVRYMSIMGCTILGLSYVANGILDAYLRVSSSWDFVAGAAVIEGSGGKITDFEGKPIDWFKDKIELVSSNGKIHNKIIDLIHTGAVAGG